MSHLQHGLQERRPHVSVEPEITLVDGPHPPGIVIVGATRATDTQLPDPIRRMEVVYQDRDLSAA